MAKKPSSSTEVRGLFIHDIKEVEGVRQQEDQEDKRDEEIGDEVKKEVEEVMHWHHLRSHSRFLQVFQVTSHIVGFRSVLRVVNFDSCRCNHLLNFDPYANSL